ncbi:transposable element Tcb2 transposase [Trichonephila clavipes]|nr:transposable element Tcb2 transposase [Trichonephila clavipes]
MKSQGLGPKPKYLHGVSQGLGPFEFLYPFPRNAGVKGRASVEDDKSSGLPQTFRTAENIEKVSVVVPFQTTGTAVIKVGGGHPRTTGDDRYIILQVKRGRRQSASINAQQLSTATGQQALRFTVARRLHKGGLFTRRPERCLPLKVDHRRHRLQWCREHKNWTTDQWSRVLFTDESRFSTRSDSQRFLIWREIGTRFYPSNIKERHRYVGPGVLVW